MALVHIGYRIVDDDGDTSTVSIKVPEGSLTLAEIREYAQELGTAMDAVIDGVIQAITATVGVTLPGGLSTTPVTDCEVQKGALLSFTANGTTYRHSVRIPSWTPSMFSGNTVDNTGAVTTFLAAITAGLDASGTQVQPCDKYENDLVTYLEGVKSFRRK